jgi:alkylhydroperoxidase/carboxymuconolactone decarboxylase family protein YurZ
MGREALSAKDVRLIRLAVGTCSGLWDVVRELRRSAPDGEPDRAWREIVLQTHLFAGFPRVVEVCEVLASEGGLGTPEDDEARPQGDHFEAGRALFDVVYASRAADVRSALQDYHPTLERWIEGHAYGRVLARGGLAADRRELAAVACLASLEQDRQLASHVRGAVHCGATPGEVRAALDAVADLLPEASLRRAQRVVDRFLPRADA